jgi:hypothetical protein
MPNLILTGPDRDTASNGVTLAVYAPFGTDAVLSTYPGNVALSITEHPLVLNLVEVSRCGVHVAALVDLHGDDTYLVEIPAHKPEALRVTSRWKQQMQAVNTLSGFLRHAQSLCPGSTLVLALEGHGAGYLPELDLSKLTTMNLTQEGSFEWRITDGAAAPVLPASSGASPTVRRRRCCPWARRCCRWARRCCRWAHPCCR